jgi:hypothetical protein
VEPVWGGAEGFSKHLAVVRASQRWRTDNGAFPLFGRRIHISGSVIDDAAIASASDVNAARELVAGLVKRGANFVIPVDAEPVRKCDGLAICFD